ncbi:hypothetical protein PF005_g1910 [Phytophthora fragariae]|uniref:Uncharacterized protein n=1 Tax=Phytophthora fragariae TaxID=53985 RepID=A0A6A3FQP4_9STRA|nr:hypothetical protein PF003_g27235 [Phytophthora fragariae]KAE8948435.1 hypothetical protein PF009_g2012 [Phytophthora fragariae]KAE9027741.1 hypothetical protein PF011_g1911 [Phytophthora fragariae]KAE9132963.1 hypothetical protein PF010_g3004 [Phytophthora fragariae]KAE9136847.1 hypothetical protein PF007_g2027 [Phytophthora fragariae]
MVQRELLRDLVERSHERVVQVRAGNSLLHVLQQQSQPPQLGSSTSLPLFPPAPALASKRRVRKAINAEFVDGDRARQRRDALPRLARDVVQHLPEAATSFEQYQSFMANKIYREETMHLQNRRAALVPKADLLKKLAVVCAAALKEMEREEEAPAVRQSLREKLVRAMALLQGGRAFEQAKSLGPPPPPVYGETKNSHLAFLQFKRDGVGTSTQKHPHPTGMQDGNTSTKTPIHFGDQICLLSSSSDLPLAIGPDGRSRPAEDSSAGPHMTFTIVDFRNPSRFDEVTAKDDFWLRVDPAVLVPRKFDARQLCFNSGDDEASDPTNDGGDGDDLTSLLSDTSYYLGCPGWLDDGESILTSLQETTVRAQMGNAHTAVNARNLGEPRLRAQKRFRIVVMKALTASKEYYGDDATTREYAVETNDGIMRLARWRFERYTPRKHEQVGKAGGATGPDSEQDVNDAMVNCSVVYLVLSDFALVYDEDMKRGVGIHVSPDSSASPSEMPRIHRNGHRRRHRVDSNDDGSVVTNASLLSACARWQVRILQRTGGVNYLQELELAMAAVTGDVRKEDGARVEWLRKKQEEMASNNRRLHAKSGLVLDARRQYDLVAVRSNTKLEQIEREKGLKSVEYFQQRLKALETTERDHHPYEILQLKQQQLQQVVELRHIRNT